MAYQKEKLNVIDLANIQGDLTLFKYSSSVDSMSVILASGYFVPDSSDTSDVAQLLKVGDVILVKGSDESKSVFVTALDPITSTSSPLSSSGTHTTDWAGPYAATAGNLAYQVVGDVVTLTFPQITGTQTSASVLTAATVLPADLRPAVQSEFIIRESDNAVIGTTVLIVGTDGSMVIYGTVGGGNTTGTAAFTSYATSISYSLV